MAYKIIASKQFAKDYSKLDEIAKIRIKAFILQTLKTLNNPRSIGKPLKGKYKGAWRYRVGAYRILADIRDKELILQLIKLSHRRSIYQ
jgi:mRNA interferase RelE/StbE